MCAGVGSGGGFRRVPAYAGVGSGDGSRRLGRAPVCAGVGSGGGFRKVPEGSGVCWGSEGSGEFRCGLWDTTKAYF